MADRNVRLITKRTSVPGKIPTGTTGSETNFINQGELASNLVDKKLFSYDGSNVFEFGVNSFLGLTGGTITGPSVFSGGIKSNSLTATSITSTTINTGSISATTYLGLPKVTGSFGLTVDGGGNVITSGVKGYLVMPYNATITGWDIIGDISGTCKIDIWKNTSIPTSVNTITGTEAPLLFNQQINSKNNLTTFNTGLAINDILAFNVISASTVSRINLIIKVIKT